ncbi:uncharacterized protein PV09_01802 [Verruconis gallopava]|uniref:SMP-LTD domain-containing protein n=1 Tax=Verruconis gallopava TaxID=253628 RepID=A0A0D2AMZ7_9PEZI|nr:uncharacterized protein PV09_01802 [Verruconis gallopava]KIW07890.1 hypothetical protein PV09_01802 [Verruconis gallopava]
MGSFLSIILAYVLGGLTFLPLLVLLTFCHAYYMLPVVDPEVEQKESRNNTLAEPGDNQPDLSNLPVELQKPDREKDAAAGYFAISREFVPGGVNGKPPERLTPAGEVVAVESPSVYQSMYRSIFERGKPQGPSFDATPGISKATKKSRNVFYVVLRLGHLMLYDNADQIEVRYVISLGLYDVDVYGGGEEILEGELWVRRNCIRLRKRETDYTLRDSKPYYFFSDNCSEKEDFYHALIQNQHRSSTNPKPPILPLRFESEHMVKLVQQLHGSEELMQTRWFNALLGRLFLSLYKTSEMHSLIHSKITKKLTRIQKPSFIEQVKVGKIDMGTSAPLFTNPKLRELTLDGELIVEMDVRYSGGFRLEIATSVLIDLGKRFNVRRIDILLAGICKSLEGHLLIKVKPPPCNRIWISFETMPKVDMSIEPIVSSRQITYGLILRTIESKIREVIGETLVLPNWDDIPFSRTEGQAVRGGLWEHHGSNYRPPDDATAPSEDQLEEKEAKLEPSDVPKSQSTPSLIRRRPVGTTSDKNNPTRGAADSAETSGRASPASKSKPKTIRSSSFASTSPPVVSMSPTHASAFRNETPNSLGDAASTMKSLSSRSSSTSSTPPAEPQALDISAEVDEAYEAKEGEEHDMFDMEMPVDETPRPSNEAQRSLREGKKSSISVEGFGSSHLEENEKKRRNLVSGAQVATAAARKWGLDLVAKRASVPGSSDSIAELSAAASGQGQPIGRGQPLPPPGQPLPGPPNAFRKSWTTALGSIGRKKVPSNVSSLAGLTENAREAALKAAKGAVETTPPLPPRPSTENAASTPSTPSLAHSRKGSIQQSRRASTRSSRASVESGVSDDVLVIKAPETEDDVRIADDGSEERNALGIVEDVPRDEEADETPKKAMREAAAADVEGEDGHEDNDEEEENAMAGSEATLPARTDEASMSGENIKETSETKKIDKESLELLESLVH